MNFLEFIIIWFLFGFVTAFIIAPFHMKIKNRYALNPEEMSNGLITLLILFGLFSFGCVLGALFIQYWREIQWPDVAGFVNKLWRLK